MSSPLRCGCSIFGLVSLVILGVLGALFFLATRDVGPRYDAVKQTYTVDDGGGKSHVDTISSDLAASFTKKVGLQPNSGNLRQLVPALARAQLQGISLTEEEANSKLAELLAAKPPHAQPKIDRTFVELHANQPKAYAYTSLLGVRVTLSSHLTYTLGNQQVVVKLTDPHAGKLPFSFVLPFLLDWTGQRDALQAVLEHSLPPQVTAIEVRERELHITINVLHGAVAPRGAGMISAAAHDTRGRQPPATPAIAITKPRQRRKAGARRTLSARRARQLDHALLGNAALSHTRLGGLGGGSLVVLQGRRRNVALLA
ncbi:MAG: hypothetical protein ACYDCQ_08520 [Dehalococcoidia bacterium]